jgi:alcohol dehydrogenase class IV
MEISPFKLLPMPQLIFGEHALSSLATLSLVIESKAILLVTGHSSFTDTPAYSSLKESLHANGRQIYEVRVSGEPSPALIDSCCKTYRMHPISVVIAIGGGSVLDAGKALSAMLPLTDSVMEYLEGVGTKKHPGLKIPFIAVPTTAGTGSEATANAVLSQIGPAGFKRSLRHDAFVPNVAILDPCLAISCPQQVTAASGLDALTQLMEAYVSTKSSPLTDALALEGIKAIAHSLIPASTTQGHDLGHRGNLAYGAYLSGIVLANAGLGLVHGFASPIGGLFAMPHGIVCGTLQGEVLKTNIHLLKEAGASGHHGLKKYAEISKVLTGSTRDNDLDLCNQLVNFIESLIDRLVLPKLSQFGLTLEDLPQIVAQTEYKNNPVPVTQESMLEILIRRL